MLLYTPQGHAHGGNIINMPSMLHGLVDELPMFLLPL